MPQDRPDPYQKIVEQHFRVYETRAERIPGDGIAWMYYLMFPEQELERRYDEARRALLGLDEDLIVFLRREGGEDILVVAPRAPVMDKGNTVNWVLLGLTLLTTIMSGAIYWQGYAHVDEEWTWSALWSPEHLAWGFLTFALPLMAILAIHETAHFLAAKKHGLRATLPYFIPFPPIFFPIGTLGAFIRLKDPLPDRKALFDVGASGPLAGFVVAIPILLLGAMLTGQQAVDLPDRDRPGIELDAPYVLEGNATGRTEIRFLEPAAGEYVLRITSVEDEWRFDATAHIEADTSYQDTHGETIDAGETAVRTITLPINVSAARIVVEWNDGLIRFGDPLAVKGLDLVGLGNDQYLTHPTFFAGWVGLLITGINLLPASQLDGGHVARAVLGDKMKYAAYAAVGLLVFLAFRFQTWILMAILILFMGVYHPPPLNDRVELDKKRLFWAAIVAIVLLITFVPRPIIF